jgi:hypothetical protein
VPGAEGGDVGLVAELV